MHKFDLLVFLHMHKCAGGTVVKCATDAGFVFPEGHKNGNLSLPNGEPVRYQGISAGGLRELLLRQIGGGVNFMAIEWDFPRFELFPGDLNLGFFTILRSPLSRVLSNYKMDKMYQWVPRDLKFRDYADGSALFRSNNYYVRKLGNIGTSKVVDRQDVKYACSVLDRFDEVIVLESGKLADGLRRLGMPVNEVPRMNDLARVAAITGYRNEASLRVGFDAQYNFHRDNTADNFLYFDYASRP